MPVLEPLLSPHQAAEILGISASTLQTWRCVGRYNLPFVKVGRYCKYRKSDLEAFIDRRTRGRATA